MHKALLCLATISLLAAASSLPAMTITSDAPGNIFVAGKPVELSLKDAQGAAGYELVDYFGNKISSGTASGSINLGVLKPGWYELNCKDTVSETSASIGVLIDRGKAALPMDGRICTDVAAAWLVDGSSYKTVTRMIRLAGIPWVRERLSWSGTQSQNSSDINWGKYQTVADAYAAEGIHIYQIWHDSPEWSHPGRKGNVCPDDLRDVYKFVRSASEHFSHQIQAWEVWNEPDIGFWPDMSDRYSALLKAAYLGIKDGNPRAMVLQGSMCRGVSQFSKNLYECGSSNYFDVFNWHIYAKPSIYPGALASHLDLLKNYQSNSRPVWLSEAGIRLDGTEGPRKRVLNEQNRHAQCQFVPRWAAMSLAGGTDKSFFFVLPDYTEGTVQWGALQPDLTPYPSFVALSAAANIIGQSTYKGEYKPDGSKATAQIFSTPKGNVLVAWSDNESELTVPTDKHSVRVANIFGEESSLRSENGAVKVKIGPDAVYLIDIGNAIVKDAIGKPRQIGKQPRLNPSHVILEGYAGLSGLKDADAYQINDDKAFDYTVHIYNFNTVAVEGSVEVAAPQGWKVYNAKRRVTIDPMGRQVITFRVLPGLPATGAYKLTVRGEFAGENVDPCVSMFSFDLAKITPVRHEALDWANDASRWKREAAQGCALSLTNSTPGTLRFDAKFADNIDRWAYPVLQFNKPVDMSHYEGLAFDLNVPEESNASLVRVMFVETSGAHYIGTTVPTAGKRRIVFMFRNLERLDHMGIDPNGHFDPDAIAAVKLGCNAGRNYLVFEASNFELVSFKSQFRASSLEACSF